MTTDEIDIETYRYRAPTVVPLDGLRFAVLCPGWETPTRICGPLELHAVLTAYTEFNSLPAPTSAKTLRAATALASLNLTDEELDEALTAIRRTV